MQKIDRAKLTPYLLNELELFETAGVEHTRLRLQSNNIIGPPYDLALIWIAQKDAEAAAVIEQRRLAREAELAADRAAEDGRRAEDLARRKAREVADAAYRASEAAERARVSRLTVQTLAVAAATLLVGLLAWLLPRH